MLSVAHLEKFSAVSTLLRPNSVATNSILALPKPVSDLGTVVVVAPHPDDETLGCGGLIAACADLQIPLLVVNVTDGGASHAGSKCWTSKALQNLRRWEQRRALQALGHPRATIVSLGLPDGGVAIQNEKISAVARQTLMSVVHGIAGRVSTFVTAITDDHPDHRESASLVSTLLDTHSDLSIYHYHVWPPTLSAPSVTRAPNSWTLDITPALRRKRNAINCYQSQLGSIVEDDPDGFTMPQSLLDRALMDSESFKLVPGG